MPRYIFDSYQEPNVVSPIHEDLDDSLEYVVPRVFFTAEAFETISYIVKHSPDEIGWFGLVTETEHGDYLIDRILIPKQIVTGASVDIEGDAINQLVHQLLDEEEDPSRLRYHGHSHVNMSVQPSNTDQDHIGEYLETSPWFIRSIHNKKGDSRMDVFHREERVAYQNVTHSIIELSQPGAFYKALADTLKTNVNRPKPPKAKPKGGPEKTGQQARLNLPTNTGDKNRMRLRQAENFLYRFPEEDEDDLYYERLIDPFYAGKA